MSESDSEDEDLPQGIISAQISPAVADRRDAACLGVVKFELHQELFRPDGNALLKKLATEYGLEPPRKTTPNHIERMEGSFKGKGFWG